MALIVETGTAKTDAESYLSVSNADTYHSNHGNTTWASQSTSDKEIALRNATQYLDVRYSERWRGAPVDADQSLDWPRIGARDDDNELYDSDALPQVLKDATAILALKAISESLLVDVSKPGAIKRERTKVDVIVTETEYAGGRSQQKRYTLVDKMVRQLVVPGGRSFERA